MSTDNIRPISALSVPVIDRKQIAHITLELREIIAGQFYTICSITPKEEERQLDTASTVESAREIFRSQLQDITERIERKRKGKPTAAQLVTLFSLGITIHPGMTWGEAWDLIHTAISERQNERRARKLLQDMKESAL